MKRLILVTSLGLFCGLFCGFALAQEPTAPPQIDDFIDPDVESRINPPANNDNGQTQNDQNLSSPDARVGRLITNNPTRDGRECDGLKPGQYRHMHSQYTEIFEVKGRVRIRYPVYTLQGEARDGGNFERRQDEQQQAQQQQQQQQQQVESNVNLLPSDEYTLPGYVRIRRRVMRKVFFPNGRIEDREIEVDDYVPEFMINGQEAPQQEARRAPAPDGQYFDPRRFPMHRQPQQPNQHGAQNPNTPQQMRMPRDMSRDMNRDMNRDMGRNMSRGGCVVLPYLRLIELDNRAKSIDDRAVQNFLKAEPYKDLDAPYKVASQYVTPENLGPFAERDPGLKDR